MARTPQLAVLFPGQGSQAPDMRAQVERWRPDLLELAEATVSEDLFERAGDGTRWAQPAIYCAALAGWERLKDELGEPGALAGHSLGEISALAAAGALSAEDGLQLVAARGRFMQEAAEETGDGSMMAVRARERGPIEEVVAEVGLTIANDNAPDQLVLSGSLAALDAGEAALRERGVRAKRLPVAGAFHSPLMAPAVPRFRAVVEAVEIRAPHQPVLCCATAAPFTDVAAQLVEAITRPVLWTDVLRALRAGGATRFVETGPGKVLTNLVRKTLEGVDAESPLGMEAARA
jgi:[acyl-carrier-protein] S-malonyltransferase